MRFTRQRIADGSRNATRTRRAADALARFFLLAAMSASALVAVPQRALALQSFNPGDVSALTNEAVTQLLKTVGIGADHHAYMPATPLGRLIGLDVGVDVTAIKLPTAFTDALKMAGVTQPIPAALPLPKLNLRKGLPFGFDVGFSYVAYQGNRILGGDLSYAILKGGALMPALAIRTSYNALDLFFMKTRTYKSDLVLSKRLTFLLDPYVGVGMQRTTGSLDVPLGGATGLPESVSGSSSTNAAHFYAGIPLKLLILKMTFEYDYSLAGITTYGAKFSIAL